MEFLRRLFGWTPAAVEPAVLELDQLSDFIDGTLAAEVKNTQVAARALHGSIAAALAGLRAAVESLHQAKWETGDRVDARVNMLKGAFVTKARAALPADVALREEVSYRFLDDLHRTVTHALSQMTHVPPKHAVVLSQYFPKHGAAIAERIKAIEQELQVLQRFLAAEGQVLHRHQLLHVGMQNHRRLMAELAAQRHAIDEVSTALKKTEEERGEKQAQLEALLQGSAWQAYLTHTAKSAENKKRRDRLEREMRAELAPGERAVKKYAHHTGDAHATRFLEDPLPFLLEQQDEIGSLVDRVIRAGPAVALTEKEIEKLRVVEEALRSSLLEKREQYRLCQEYEAREEQAKSAAIVDKKEGLESRIAQLTAAHRELEEKKRTLMTAEAALRAAQAAQGSEIEQLLVASTGKPVSLRSVLS